MFWKIPKMEENEMEQEKQAVERELGLLMQMTLQMEDELNSVRMRQ
jgi:hypothetical protein